MVLANGRISMLVNQIRAIGVISQDVAGEWRDPVRSGDKNLVEAGTLEELVLGSADLSLQFPPKLPGDLPQRLEISGLRTPLRELGPGVR